MQSFRNANGEKRPARRLEVLSGVFSPPAICFFLLSVAPVKGSKMPKVSKIKKATKSVSCTHPGTVLRVG